MLAKDHRAEKYSFLVEDLKTVGIGSELQQYRRHTRILHIVSEGQKIS
jgi:hypothetical protein